MHDYSRDIMLANAQQDMEAGLAKMQLNKKIAATKVYEGPSHRSFKIFTKNMSRVMKTSVLH